MKLGSRPSVAVIGGGFSGLLTALHLLEAPGGPCVRLIERRDGFGRGAAYASSRHGHLLNVRASNMSAHPDRPGHFLDWLAAQGDAPAAFVSRTHYGDYLQHLLREAATQGEAGRLILDRDEAVDVAPEGDGWSVALAIGRRVRAAAVVLAVGNLPPPVPAGLDEEAAAHPAYLADPWSRRMEAAPQAGVAVLLGTGLTMVDTALRLERERPGLRLHALSRRGLLPRRHLVEGPSPSPWRPGDLRARAILREARRRAQGSDWRAVVDGLRPVVQDVWGAWSDTERGRFLRHLRPWWDVHRHRIAPQVASRLDHLTSCGRLRVARGRLAAATPDGEGLSVAWTTPDGEVRTLRASALVNCTGPNGDLTRAGDPLLSGLAAQGLIRADAHRLGLDSDPQGRLLGRDGRGERPLFGVGPVTRGALWEITSVPDIRVQARACARQVVRSLERAGAADLRRPS